MQQSARCALSPRCAAALQGGGVLTHLDLGRNELGPEGATAIAPALQDGSLTSLDLNWRSVL